MKKTLAVLALAAASLNLASCTQSATSLPPGHYESQSSATNAAGTKTSTDKSTDVYYDADGNKKATVSTKTTRDPRGLFNKTTSESTETEQ